MERPSLSAVGFVIATVVFIAGYQIWRDDHLRLQPKLQVSRVVLQSLTQATYPNTPPPPNKKTGESAAYYFEIVGIGEACTIQDVQVQLAKINPEVRNLEWLPVHLFQKHDNATGPRAKSFDLHPGAVKHIDLVSATLK